MPTPKKVLALLTDFGLTDNYTAVMKAVILNIAPFASIIDISHQVPPQNIKAAAYLLETSYAYFPKNTVFVIVVDPGVGSSRRALLLQTSSYTFIAPDNGVLTPILTNDNGKCFHLNKEEYWLSTVSQTFHGRDIFAPVAAHLATGKPATKMGSTMENPVLLTSSQPKIIENTIQLEVRYIDHFGNIITNAKENLVKSCLLDHRKLQLFINNRIVEGVHAIHNTFADVEVGECLLYSGSSGYLELAHREGSAADYLGIDYDTTLLLEFSCE